MPAPDPETVAVTRVESAAGLNDVLAIDDESFLRPWTPAMYADELARPETSHLWVARVSGEAAGYCAFWLVVDELHLNNLAVRPRFRRRGIAGALVNHALGLGRDRGARRAMLEVRASNGAARALYARMGFREVSVRRAYYREPAEDALVLWRDPI
jgi:ribosomal-protein-alanine N-acetyltransferase